METTIAREAARRRTALWPTVVQALGTTLLVGLKIQERWGTWDSLGKLIAIFLLLTIIALPAIAMREIRSAKGVRLSDLTTCAYVAIWAAAVLFTHGSR